MGSACSRSLGASKKVDKKPENHDKLRRALKLREHYPCTSSLSLVQLCLISMAQHPALTAADVNAISHDLTQELLGVMIRLGHLDQYNVHFFKLQPLWMINLASYAGVSNEFITTLASNQLMSLDLSSCDVRPSFILSFFNSRLISFVLKC